MNAQLLISDQIANALKSDYSEALEQCDAVVVCDQKGAIAFIDSGFEQVFECDSENTLSLKPFFPKGFALHQHNPLNQSPATQSGVGIADEIRYLEAQTGSGRPLKIALEICPLAISGQGFTIGFISVDRSHAIAVQQAAKQEAQIVIDSKKAQAAFAIYDGTESRLVRMYKGLAYEVLDGVPGARIIAATFVGSVAVFLCAIAAYGIFLFVRGDSTHNIRIDSIEPSPAFTPHEN